jgi:hypothetical protein
LRVLDNAIFDHLGESGKKLSTRQRGEHVDVDENELRLIKSADQIFSIVMIDPGFAADA